MVILPELSSEGIFSLHPKIRWAGLATDQGEVVFVKMRPAVQSLSPETADQSFMQLGPMLLSGVCERLAPWAGPLERIVISYQKIVMLVTKVSNRYLAMSFDKTGAEQAIPEVSRSLQSLQA